MSNTRPLAISLGEPAGIGPDLILQLFADREQLALPPFVVYGQSGFLRQRAQRLGLEIRIMDISLQGTAELPGDRLPVVPIMPENPVADSPGVPNADGAHLARSAIERAARDCLEGACRALVTGPIHKAALKRIGFAFPGHTEFLAHICSSSGQEPTPVMMLAHEAFRVVPLTIHVPLREVPDMITTDMIVEKASIVERDLRQRLGVERPRIGITGLNPHAGEEGTMGSEEQEIIVPAIARLQEKGIDAFGPLPADTAFYPANWQRADAMVAMYHDQALIPIKTIAFDRAVNVTLGLPIVRTSPDHGTAFDLAGTGTARHHSLLAALRLADQMSPTP